MWPIRWRNREMRKLTTACLCTRPSLFLPAMFALMFVAQVMAQPSAAFAVADRYPSGSIRSVDEADAALAAAARERAEVKTRYQSEERACHPKFFATDCIEQAKERRRRALSALRSVEIEANTFKRQARLENREKALAERLGNDDKERESRASRKHSSAAAVDEDGSASFPTGAGLNATVDAREKAKPAPGRDRAQQHEARLKRQQAAEAANAEKRAQNIAAYEKKKKEALERQQKVAQRKAEKERMRKKKQGPDARGE